MCCRAFHCRSANCFDENPRHHRRRRRLPHACRPGAKAAGMRVVAVGLSGSVWPELESEVDVFRTVGLTRLGSWVRELRRHGVDETIMVGRVRKGQLYSRWSWVKYIPDLRTLRLFITRIRRDKRDQTLLLSLCDALASEGFPLSDSTKYCADQLATPGVMTRRQPSTAQLEDARFGYELCTAISKLQIGQAIAIADRNVIAVEAIEGTDSMIQRAGVLCKRGGWTLIKVANTHADMRIDVPTVGVQTIEKLKAAGGVCLMLTPGKVIMLDKQQVIDTADKLGIVIVGYESATADGAVQP
ncbi:MAG: UDP-2,3-diacylglucosamine diphosphatase LpxI [Tepidisphaeraceae bacterium]